MHDGPGILKGSFVRSYGDLRSGNCYKLKLVCSLLDLPHEWVHMDILAGETLTTADISLYAYTHVAHEGGFGLEPYPALQAWLGRIAALPRYTGMD